MSLWVWDSSADDCTKYCLVLPLSQVGNFSGSFIRLFTIDKWFQMALIMKNGEFRETYFDIEFLTDNESKA